MSRMNLSVCLWRATVFCWMFAFACFIVVWCTCICATLGCNCDTAKVNVVRHPCSDSVHVMAPNNNSVLYCIIFIFIVIKLLTVLCNSRRWLVTTWPSSASPTNPWSTAGLASEPLIRRALSRSSKTPRDCSLPGLCGPVTGFQCADERRQLIWKQQDKMSALFLSMLFHLHQLKAAVLFSFQPGLFFNNMMKKPNK